MKRILQFLFIALLLNVSNVYSQNSALQFDGVDDYVQTPGFHGITGNASRTVDFWVFIPTKISAVPTFIQWGIDEPGKLFRIRSTTAAKVRVETSGGTWISENRIDTAKWVHIAVVYTSGNDLINNLKVYIDGVSSEANDKYGSEPVNTDDTQEVTIGKPGTANSWYMKGIMDEVRIWDVALTATDILLLRAKETCPETYEHLVAYYRFNEGEGTTVADKTSNHYDGILGGSADATDLQPAWVDGATITSGGCLNTGISDTGLDYSIKVFPNPASTNLTIFGLENKAKVEIFNLQGSKVFESSEEVTFPYQLDISAYRPGIYLVKVLAENPYTVKLVKQ